MARRYRARPLVAATATVAALALGGTACRTTAPPSAARPGGTGRSAAAATPSASTPASAATPAASPVDPASVHADELGAVPVLMYHQVVERPASDYDQTPENFRTELGALYDHGFRPVTAAALVTGHVDLPAGTSPMVLTFDDSTTSQFSLGADGQVDPRCAVGILRDVAARHGDPRPVATFYVNQAPFGGHPEYLRLLSDLGMELGDHTASHANLGRLDAPGVQRELVVGQAVVEGALPLGQKVVTMALPYGVFPRDHALASQGASGAATYHFSGVMLVGANPAPSPFAASFVPLAVPRIRSGRHSGDLSFTASYWLPRLFSGAVRRYVSDGDPAHVAFPRAEAALLSPRFAAVARPY